MQTSALNTRFSAVKFYSEGVPGGKGENVTGIGITTRDYDKTHNLRYSGVYTVACPTLHTMGDAIFIVSPVDKTPIKVTPEGEDESLLLKVYMNRLNKKTQGQTRAEALLTKAPDPASLDKKDYQLLDIWRLLMPISLLVFGDDPHADEPKPVTVLKQWSEKLTNKKLIEDKKITFDPAGEIRFNIQG